MKKVLVFVTAFALVLTTGAALALMGTSEGDRSDGEPAAVEKSVATVAEKPEKQTADDPVKGPVIESQKAEEEQVDHKSDEEDHNGEMVDIEEPKDTDPPDLVITHPEDGEHFDHQKIAFEGKTEPGARVYAGKYEGDVDAEGNWRITLILTNDGGNKATFTATDPAGNETTASVTAYYDAPVKEEPKDEKAKTHEFTVQQKFGTCAEDPPYDVWYGTGEPGTKISIASDFGSGSTTIGEKGKWDLKVKFFDAPCNQTISVVLETDQGHRKVYEFTRICEEGGGDHEGEDK